MARSDVLVTTDWAESNLNAPNTVFVEVDEDTSAYDTGHIEGAVKLDWKTDLQDPVRRDFVDAQQFSKLLSDRGISNDDTVILYGGNNNWFAAYAYWYFKLYGHENVKLLDGGRKKWELDGRPLSSEPVSRPATSYTAKQPDNSIRAFRDEVIAAIGQKNLVDVRSPTSSPARSSRPRTCRRSRASAPATSRRPSTCRGARPPTRTAPSSRTRISPRSTPTPAWTARRKPSPTAASGALVAHLVRAAGTAGTQERQELRRQLDRIRLPGGGPDRVGKLVMCAPPKQGLALPASVDLEKETVITGRVVDGSGQAVGGAFVRLLDASDEFTAEVVASATGDFRFFAAPGTWTLRALSKIGNGDATVAPSGAGIHEVDVKVA